MFVLMNNMVMYHGMCIYMGEVCLANNKPLILTKDYKDSHITISCMGTTLMVKNET